MHGGLEKAFHKFPKAIQDAIKLVRQLGVQYLCVDALCIVQDSARSWKLNAYNMDLIYGNAIFTICAADGVDASTGLLAMDELAGTGSDDQLIAACTKDIKLMITRPPEMYIEASIWKTLERGRSKNDSFREDVLYSLVAESTSNVNQPECQRISTLTERALAGHLTSKMHHYRSFGNCLCDPFGCTCAL
jgi:hypothetical protein